MNSRILKNTIQRVYGHTNELHVNTISTYQGNSYKATLDTGNFKDELRKACLRIVHPTVAFDVNAPLDRLTVGTIEPNSLLMTADQWRQVFEYLSIPLDLIPPVTATTSAPPPMPDIPPVTTSSDNEDESEDEDKKPCDDCEDLVDEDTLTEVDGGNRVCEACLDADYRACRHCEDYFKEDEGGTVTDSGAYYCEDCESDYTFYCEDCSTSYSTNDSDSYSVEDGNRTVCYSCSENYNTCSNCDSMEYSDNSRYCDNCEQDFCESCYDEHPCENNTFREIDEPTFLEGEPTSQIQVKRFVGVEIEVEKGEPKDLASDLRDTIAIVHDGSISGVEINTPPASGDKLVDIINHTCEVLKNHNYKGTRACGVHIHLDARDIQNDHKKIVQVVKTYYALEDIIYSILPPSRWQSNYCKRLAQDYLYKNFKNTKKDTKAIEKQWYKSNSESALESKKHQKYDSTRYYGVNIHSIFYRGTLELRYHSGTTSPRKILSWIDFNLKILDYAISRYNERDIQQLFDMATSADKLYKVCQMINASYDLRQYLEERASKFNRNFRVKFNKGKEARDIERKELAGKKREAGLRKANIMRTAKKEVNRQLVDRYGVNWKNEVTDEDLEAMIEDRYRSLLHYNLSDEYKKLPIDGGFIKNEELTEYVELIEQGIRIGAESAEGEEL